MVKKNERKMKKRAKRHKKEMVKLFGAARYEELMAKGGPDPSDAVAAVVPMSSPLYHAMSNRRNTTC